VESRVLGRMIGRGDSSGVKGSSIYLGSSNDESGNHVAMKPRTLCDAVCAA
jgi:hypothetical protein